MQQQGRLRLRAWLEKQIHSGEYPGVRWLDRAALIFQIPWKHAARHGWSIDRDATLFRSWAIHTGRYHPGQDKPDPKTWKANFRCALNSLSDICELREHSKKKGTNAYRVYRMLPTKSVKRKRGQRSRRPRSHSTNRDNDRCAIQPWQSVRSTPDPTQRVEACDECTTSYGLPSETDEQEKKEAVFKLMDQLNHTESWSYTCEPRTWRAHSLENHWHWPTEDFTTQADSYTDLFPSYIKELSDWSSNHQTLMQ